MTDKLMNKLYKPIIKSINSIKYSEDSFRKIGTLSHSKRRINRLYKEITNNIPNIEASRTGSGLYFEITKAGASKATAAQKYSELSGISLSNSMAIGDSENDKKILQVVGHPVAMGNSKREIKSISKYVTRSVRKQGVSVIIDEVVLE